MRALCRAAVLVLVLAIGSRARADELTVGTTEFGGWAQSIAQLESDVGAQGGVVHVTVTRGDGQRLACGDYQLSLDAIGSAAFDVGGCDGGATVLTLRDRDALFDPGLPPRPRLVGITVARLQTSGARGGASMQGGSTLHCAVEVHPYLVDEQHGGRVPLVPGAYDVRVTDSNATVARAGDGWTVRGTDEGQLTVHYEVVDAARGDVVLRRRLSLDCSDGAEGDSGSAPEAPPPTPDPMAHAFMILPLRLTTHVFPNGVRLDGGGQSAAFATQELYLDMDFAVTPWMYVGIDYPVFGYSAVPEGQASLLDMGIGGVLGFHTSTAPFQFFGEAAFGMLMFLGDVRAQDGSNASPSGIVPTAEARIGVNWVLASNVAFTAYIADNVLSVSQVSGGVGLVFWI